MRLVNVIQRYPPAIGGSETWCQEVCRQLAKLGHDVSVLTLDITEEEEFWRDLPHERRTVALGPLDLDEGVRVRRFRRSIPVHSVHHGIYRLLLDDLLKVYFYGPHSLEMYLKLPAYLRDADAVLLHTVPYPHNPVAAWVARRLGKPIFLVPHFHPTHPFFERWHHYRLLRRCDGVFPVSEYEKELLAARGVAAERMVVTGNGVHEARYQMKDPEAFDRQFRQRHGLSTDTRLVLFVGRKLEEKGVAHLLDACEKVSARHPLALLLAGPPSDWFRAWFARRVGPHESLRVIDLGEVPEEEKVALLHVADVLALPSRFEAFGIVFLEAWASGTPVVGSDSGAVPSVLGDAGLTAPYGDAAALAERLDRVLSDASLAHRLVDAGREKIRTRYRWDRIAARVARGVAARARPRMRLLYVSTLFPPYFVGGAEIIAWRHALGLRARGHELGVFAGRLDENAPRYGLRRERRDRMTIHRVALHPADISADERNHDHAEVALLFREVVRAQRPDVVHVHNLSGLSVEIVEHCRELGIPVVMTLHDYWGICFKNTMVKNDGRVCLESGPDCPQCLSHVGTQLPTPVERRNQEIRRGLDGVTCFLSPSEYLARRYRENGFGDKRIALLPYGIDLTRFTPRHRSHRPPCRIGYNGYVGAHKGIHVLLEAMTRVRGARLVLRGPCEDPAGYAERIRELGIEGSVELRPPVPNQKVPRALQQNDLAVLPSVWPDNHPVSVLEAMAAGLPVVASRIGGIPEMVRQGETGLLVEPGDPEDLARHLQQLVDDAPLLESMGTRAREVAEAEYEAGRLLDELEDVYRDAIAFPAGAPLEEPVRSGAEPLVSGTDPRVAGRGGRASCTTANTRW